jgi:6-phospho-beta-glucosidase
VKLAIIGGGGFRTPAMVQAASASGLFDEIVLHDVDGARLARVDAVLRRLELPVRATLDLDHALAGAGVVFCAIRVGGLPARLRDEVVPLELGLLGQETVGAGGLCYALRTLPAVLAIAERTPGDAWFLNYTNPAGLVTEALTEVLGDRAVGVCDAPAALFAGVRAALGREAEFDYGGLNHLGWLKAARVDGRDVLPELLADHEALATFHEGRIFGGELLRALGRIPNEYLAYYYSTREIVAALRGEGPRAASLLEREREFYGSNGDALVAWRTAVRRRSASYMAEVTGEAGREEDVPDDLGLGGYAAVALEAASALLAGEPAELVLNARNRGAIPFLDDDAVVEVPCRVDAEGVRTLPSSPWTLHEQGLISLVKDAERATIEAARTGSRAQAVRALALHPLVASIEAARHILEREGLP